MHRVHALKNPTADGLFNQVLRFIHVYPVHLLNSQPLLKSDDVPDVFICSFPRKKISEIPNRLIPIHCYSGIA